MCVCVLPHTNVNFFLFSSSTFNQMMMGSIGYIISGLISTLICVCACKLCKKRGSRWIRRLMEIDAGGSQSERQVEEVSSSWAVIEMQEFPDSDDNPYEVPMPPPLTVMASVTYFVSASTTNNDTVQHQSSSPHDEQQEGAEGGNDQTLPKTVEGEIDITPSQSWLPPLSRSYIREKSFLGQCGQ